MWVVRMRLVLVQIVMGRCRSVTGIPGAMFAHLVAIIRFLSLNSLHVLARAVR